MKKLWRILFIVGLINVTLSCKGCINLDEFNFDKIISRFNVVLVKFDVAYPYGREHDAFTSVATDFVDNENLIFAEVGVKDYGERENELLAKKYGLLSKDDFPVLKLFVKNNEEPFTFPKTTNWSVNSIKKFISDNTNIYIGLPGCSREYDKLANEFINSKNQEEIYEKMKEEMTSVKDEKKLTLANTYLKYMEKIMYNGNTFAKQEYSRLDKLVKQGNVNAKKKNELSNRLNILKSFTQFKTEL